MVIRGKIPKPKVKRISLSSGRAEPIFNWGKLENERWRREFLERSEAILPQKNLKYTLNKY